MSERSSYRIFLVGTGSAGTALGLWLSRRGQQLVGAWNRSEGRGRRASEFLPVQVSTGELAMLSDCDLVLVSVSDDSVALLGEQLRGMLRPGMILVHTSGSLPASALGEQPVPRGSLHPLVAMREPHIAADALNRTLLTVEGDEAARERLLDLMDGVGAKVQTLNAKAKTTYHAAAVIAANLAVALVAEATELAAEAGVDDAERALAELALVAMKNVTQQGAASGLTGPVIRGDIGTVQTHLDVLVGDTREMYRLLSRRAVELARVQGLSAHRCEELLALLGREN
ncbi:MAG: DUF2520 domain-containing protein [Myxococcota bacterium]